MAQPTSPPSASLINIIARLPPGLPYRPAAHDCLRRGAGSGHAHSCPQLCAASRFGVCGFKGFFRMSFFVPRHSGRGGHADVGLFLYTIAQPGRRRPASSSAPAFFFQPVSHLLVSVGNVVTWEWAGYNMIIIIASLQSISTEIYQAAGLDGCGAMRTAWYIKIPMVRPGIDPDHHLFHYRDPATVQRVLGVQPGRA